MVELVGLEPTTSSFANSKPCARRCDAEEVGNDITGQCSCGSDLLSLPLNRTWATLRETRRDGQGSEGYDTSHATNFLPPDWPSRQLSRPTPGVEWPVNAEIPIFWAVAGIETICDQDQSR